MSKKCTTCGGTGWVRVPCRCAEYDPEHITVPGETDRDLCPDCEGESDD